MNASATIRASYIRAARQSLAPLPVRALSNPGTTTELAPRPPINEKLNTFQPVNHIEHREKCHIERSAPHLLYDVKSYKDSKNAYIDHRYLDNGASSLDLDKRSSLRNGLRKMYTVFPYRDPIYLVAIIFTIGSIDLVINAFFDLTSRTMPTTAFKTEEGIAVPATVLLGSILFFVAGVFDIFGALNADRGSIESTKEDPGSVTYRPALLGSQEFKWVLPGTKFANLTMNNLTFQAGLVVLVGGVIFMFAGIVDFPGVVRENSRFNALIVFGPQATHGAMFFIANTMLAISEQERWYKPKVADPDWQGAFLNAIGGFGFMMAGLFLFQRDEFKAAVAAMTGSWAFLIGSTVRWYVVMEFW